MAGYDPSACQHHCSFEIPGVLWAGRTPPNFHVTSRGGAGSPLILQIPREARPPIRRRLGVGRHEDW